MTAKKTAEKKPVEKKEEAHFAVVMEVKFQSGLFSHKVKHLVMVVKTDGGTEDKLAIRLAAKEAVEGARILFPKFKCRVLTTQKVEIIDKTKKK